jgi:hypothetical protein
LGQRTMTIIYTGERRERVSGRLERRGGGKGRKATHLQQGRNGVGLYAPRHHSHERTASGKTGSSEQKFEERSVEVEEERSARLSGNGRCLTVVADDDVVVHRSGLRVEEPGSASICTTKKRGRTMMRSFAVVRAHQASTIGLQRRA